MGIGKYLTFKWKKFSFDLFDVPVSEKAQMQTAIESGLSQPIQQSESISPMKIFINNVRNREMKNILKSCIGEGKGNLRITNQIYFDEVIS